MLSEAEFKHPATIPVVPLWDPDNPMTEVTPWLRMRESQLACPFLHSADTLSVVDHRAGMGTAIRMNVKQAGP